MEVQVATMTSAELLTWDVDFDGQRVVYRSGAVEGLGSVARRLGMSNVLLVTDRGVIAAGHVDRALAALAAASVKTVVYDAVERFNGSISAEHGVGQAKREQLARYKSETEITLMRQLKRALDPDNRLNPGKVI